MPPLDILLYPHPALREKCRPVSEIDEEILQLLDSMTETMYEAPGIGLAASQVGSIHRVIVVDVGDDEATGRTGRLYQLINPEIVEAEGSIESEEGCLSIPDVRESVKRSKNIVVRALDRSGKELAIDADGLLSICLQHEIDHLDGILFIDRISRLRRELIKKRLRKIGQDRG